MGAARDSQTLRFVMRGNEPTAYFAELFTYIYVITFLGLCAGYCMRLQAVYLNSHDSIIFTFAFHDVQWIFGGKALPAFGRLRTASSFMSILEQIYTITMFGLSVVALHKATTYSKTYYLEKIGDPVWRREMGIGYDRKFVVSVREQKFISSIAPAHILLFISLAMVIIATIVPYWSLLFVIAVVCACLGLMRNRASTVSGGEIPPAEPSDSVIFRPLTLTQIDRIEIVRLLKYHASGSFAPNLFYVNLVERANMPDEYKDNIRSAIENRKNPALTLVDASLNQGVTPPEYNRTDNNSTIVASLLIALMDQVGLDFQCFIVQKLEKCDLIKDKHWLGRINQETCGRWLQALTQ